MEKSASPSLLKTAGLGTIVSLCISILFVLALAFCLRFFGFSEGALDIIVEIIKGASILCGTFWAFKTTKENGLIGGALIGFGFTIVSFLVFSILDGFTFDFSTTLFTNLIFGSIIGAISGIISVNVKETYDI